MKKSFIYAAKVALYSILLTGIFAACSNSTSSDDHEEEPVGLRVYTASSTGTPNQLVVEQSYNSNTQSTEITGNFSITDQPHNFTVVFLDEDGDEFVPDLSEHDITVTATENSGNIEIARPNITVQNLDFSLRGISESSAKIRIALTHLGGVEFTSSDLDVVINIQSAQ
jgi:hypothetical protein